MAMKLLCDRCEFEEFATVMMSIGARACSDCMELATQFFFLMQCATAAQHARGVEEPAKRGDDGRVEGLFTFSEPEDG